MDLPELTDEERKEIDSMDMTPILGSPAERLRLALDKAVDFMMRLKVAEASQKMAWSEQRQQAELAEKAFTILRQVRKDSRLGKKSQAMIDEFLGPWEIEGKSDVEQAAS